MASDNHLTSSSFSFNNQNLKNLEIEQKLIELSDLDTTILNFKTNSPTHRLLLPN
jgi:hypothetical protein